MLLQGWRTRLASLFCILRTSRLNGRSSGPHISCRLYEASRLRINRKLAARRLAPRLTESSQLTVRVRASADQFRTLGRLRVRLDSREPPLCIRALVTYRLVTTTKRTPKRVRVIQTHGNFATLGIECASRSSNEIGREMAELLRGNVQYRSP